MLAGNLGVTPRREPPLALTTIEGCCFFFQIHQIVIRHQRFLVHFVWDLNGLTFKHGMLAKGNL